MRSRFARRYGAVPPCASGFRFCSTVNFTSSAVISPQPSWKGTPERSLNVHVRISFEGFHSVASPGRYSEGLGIARDQRVVRLSPRGTSPTGWCARRTGVSMPHCPTATTRRSPAPTTRATAREGARRGCRAPASALRLRNVRRSTNRAMIDVLRRWRWDLVTSAAWTPGNLRPPRPHVKPTAGEGVSDSICGPSGASSP